MYRTLCPIFFVKQTWQNVTNLTPKENNMEEADIEISFELVDGSKCDTLAVAKEPKNGGNIRFNKKIYWDEIYKEDRAKCGSKYTEHMTMYTSLQKYPTPLPHFRFLLIFSEIFKI